MCYIIRRNILGSSQKTVTTNKSGEVEGRDEKCPTPSANIFNVLMYAKIRRYTCLCIGWIDIFYFLIACNTDLIGMFGCHMHLQVVHSSKLHKTNLASKRFLSCVNKQMPFKQGTFLKGFQTDFTLETS